MKGKKGLPTYVLGVLRDILEQGKSDSVSLHFSSGGVRNTERAYSLPRDYDLVTALSEMAGAGGRYEYRLTIANGRIEKQRVTEFLQPSRG